MSWCPETIPEWLTKLNCGTTGKLETTFSGIFPALTQETGSGLSRVFSSRDQRYQCQFAACLPSHCHSMVRGHLALFHTNKNTAAIRGRNFLQLVIDTSKVRECCSKKVPFQHFTVTHPQAFCLILLDNTRKNNWDLWVMSLCALTLFFHHPTCAYSSLSEECLNCVGGLMGPRGSFGVW